MAKDNNFTKMFRSYMIVVTIPLIVVGIVTIIFFYIRLANDTKSFNQNVIRQGENMLDVTVGETLGLYWRFRNSDVISGIVEKSREGTGLTSYDFLKVRQDFSNYIRDDVFETAGIYFQSYDVFIDQLSVYSFSEYYNTYLSDSSYDYNWWEKKFQKGIGKPFFVESNLPEKKLGNQTIIYAQPLDATNKENGALFVAWINSKTLEQRLKTAGVDGDISYAVLNGDNRIIFKSDGFDLEGSLDKIIYKRGEFKQGRDWVFYCQSASADLKYIFTIPIGGLAGNVHYIAYLFILLLLAGIGLSGYLAKTSAARMQKPILAIYDENISLTASINDQIENARKQVLENLLYNVETREPWLLEIIERHGIGISGEKYRVITFGNSYLAEEAVASGSEIPLDLWNNVQDALFCFAEQNKLQLRFVNKGAVDWVAVFGYAGTVDFYTALKKISNDFYTLNKAVVAFGIGEETEQLSMLYKSHDGASIALRYCLHNREKPVVAYVDIKDMENSKVYYTNEIETALIRNVKTGAAEKLNALLDEIQHINFYERRLSYNILKRLIANMVLTIYKLADDCLPGDPDEVEKNARVCQGLLQNTDVDESFEMIRCIFLSMCKKMEQRDERTQQRNDILRYIDQHYMDSNLSLNMLADYAGVNYYYFSRLFKELVGSNFASYITSVRMEKAREFLGNSKNSVKDVAEMVGFVDSNSFIRAYKKYFNVTPGSYNKKHKYRSES